MGTMTGSRLIFDGEAVDDEEQRASPNSRSAAVASPGAAGAPGEAGVPRRNRRERTTCDVLIVEDDRAIRESLLDLLLDEGYTVVTARDGREALQSLRDGEVPALILLDLMMPVMNGWEFRAEQRRDPALARIPVVAVSGAGNLDQRAAALNLGEYLSKPVPVEVLLETVARYCD